MLDLQGFIQIPALFDNQDGVTAPVGELSDLTLSYAKSKQTFTKTNLQVQLVTFTSNRFSMDLPASHLGESEK